jgi:hypothetical protein
LFQYLLGDPQPFDLIERLERLEQALGDRT